MTSVTRRSITPAVAIYSAFLGALLMVSANCVFLLANSASTALVIARGIVRANNFAMQPLELCIFSLPLCYRYCGCW